MALVVKPWNNKTKQARETTFIFFILLPTGQRFKVRQICFLSFQQQSKKAEPFLGALVSFFPPLLVFQNIK